jgi:hypothetical protein
VQKNGCKLCKLQLPALTTRSSALSALPLRTRAPTLHPLTHTSSAPTTTTSLITLSSSRMSRYGGYLSPQITPQSTPSKSKSQKSRSRREPSGVFSLFSPPQIQQFREAFSLIDHDGDGVVSEQDLKHIFTSLGESHEIKRKASIYLSHIHIEVGHEADSAM